MHPWQVASLAIAFTTLSLNAAGPEVEPIPDPIRQRLRLDPFYQQQVALGDLLILGSTNVSHHALREAAWILTHMLGDRRDLLQAMADRGVWVTVMAWNEFTTDVPEHRDLKPRVYWDRRARGLGGSPVSCAEENLLQYPGDPYAAENILIHEFAHALHAFGMAAVDPTFDRRLQDAYAAAIAKGLWAGTYAGTNHEEYWAEAVQDWFDDNRQNDGLHNHVNTRAELKDYDPALAALCAEVLGETSWRYRRPTQRSAEDRAHLQGYDLDQAPHFRWREEPIPARPQVLLQTAMGDITLELEAKAAPLTVANFLWYVHEGLYADGTFFRTVRLDNQPTNHVKIQVVQANANAARTNEFRPPIPLETTRTSGLHHQAGSLSMARADPDSAQDHFFICLEDAPVLDFGGERNPDGQGFAAFGRVIRGLEVVRRIHAAPAQDQLLDPPVRIQRAIRLN